MVESKKTKSQLTSDVVLQSSIEDFSIAGELVKARTKAGISQSQLAERSKISRNTLMGYESGRNKPGARELMAICQALAVTPNRLLFGREEPFAVKSSLEQLGFDSSDKQAAIFPMLLKMLTRDEQSAVITLIHGLVEARHGKKVIDATTKMYDVIISKFAGDVKKPLTQEDIEEAGRAYAETVGEAKGPSSREK